MTGAPVLPGSLRDLLAPGMTVYHHADLLHAEFDPDAWRPYGGIVHTVTAEHVGTVVVGLRWHTDGLALGTFPTADIHNCDDEYCQWRPRPTSAASVRYTARWLLRIVGAGAGRLTDRDRRLTAVAVSLLTKGLP